MTADSWALTELGWAWLTSIVISNFVHGKLHGFTGFSNQSSSCVSLY